MKFQRIYPAVYYGRVGKPPHSLRGIPAREDALRAMGDAPLPRQAEDIWIGKRGGRYLLRLPLEDGERIYGMGIQYFRQNQRGRTRYLRVNSDPCVDNGESNAPLPFFISDRGYALFLESAHIVTVWCGSAARLSHKEKLGEKDSLRDDFTWTAPSDEIEIEVGGGAAVYFFAGNIAECVRRYNLFCGGGCLPPIWSLGIWHRVGREYTEEQTLAEAEEYRRRGFPCDVIGLEPGWQSNSYPCSLEWSFRFPDPARLCKTLRGRGFRVNTWQHLYLSEKSAVYGEMDGHCGDYTVWGGIVPDLCDGTAASAMRREWQRGQIDVGVAGMKLDESDGSELTKFSWIFPPHARFPRGGSGEEYRQKMGILYQREAERAFAERGKRTFGLSRSSGAYASPLPFGVYTDLYDHGQFVRALVNAGYCGMIWVPEVRGAENGEEWLRRFQTAVFSPITMLNGWYDKLLPWSFPSVEGEIRRLLELRMRLVPYLYTAFREYAETGMPVCRPMNVAFGAPTEEFSAEYVRASGFGRVHPWDVFEDELDGQYMFGPSLLVAPVICGEREKIIWLPAGKWYDFFTGKVFEGGRFLRRAYAPHEIPVFVREGTVLPLAVSADCTERISGEIEVFVFGKGRCEGTLYEDDGESFRYRCGEFRILRLTTEGKGTERVEAEGNYGGKYTVTRWIYTEE